MPSHKRYRETVTVEVLPLFDLVEETAAAFRTHPTVAVSPIPGEVLAPVPVVDTRGPRTRSGRRSGR
jgi:hypothetical protein